MYENAHALNNSQGYHLTDLKEKTSAQRLDCLNHLHTKHYPAFKKSITYKSDSSMLTAVLPTLSFGFEW